MKIYTFHVDEKTGITCDSESSKWLDTQRNKYEQFRQERIMSIFKEMLLDLNNVDKKSKSAILLGSIKSDKKTKSSRLNGKRGGRPKKYQSELDQPIS